MIVQNEAFPKSSHLLQMRMIQGPPYYPRVDHYPALSTDAIILVCGGHVLIHLLPCVRGLNYHPRNPRRHASWLLGYSAMCLGQLNPNEGRMLVCMHTLEGFPSLRYSRIGNRSAIVQNVSDSWSLKRNERP